MRDANCTPPPAPEWQPSHPDPALTDPHRPGLRAHRHPPNRLHTFVFRQHQVWVDYWGNEVEIETISRDYAANVVSFCQQQAERIHHLVVFDSLLRQVECLFAGVRPDATVLDDVEAACTADPLDWLQQTPLIRALQRRLERQS